MDNCLLYTSTSDNCTGHIAGTDKTNKFFFHSIQQRLSPNSENEISILDFLARINKKIEEKISLLQT